MNYRFTHRYGYDGDCPGRDDPTARQGHYVDSDKPVEKVAVEYAMGVSLEHGRKIVFEGIDVEEFVDGEGRYVGTVIGLFADSLAYFKYYPAPKVARVKTHAVDAGCRILKDLNKEVFGDDGVENIECLGKGRYLVEVGDVSAVGSKLDIKLAFCSAALTLASETPDDDHVWKAFWDQLKDCPNYREWVSQEAEENKKSKTMRPMRLGEVKLGGLGNSLE